MKQITQSIRILTFFSVTLGLVYPIAMTAIGAIFFPFESSGSVLKKGNQIIGSQLLSQKFEKAEYFWPRPSGGDFATVASGASNLGPTSADLKKAIDKHAADLRKSHEIADNIAIPELLLTTSASGLDPDLSPEAIRFQVARVAKARHFDSSQTERLKTLVETSIQKPVGGVIGEETINVLLLNLKLDELH